MSLFVEVGTADFDTCEKLITNGWSGVCIEPVKYYFKKLPKYPNIHYENIAISDKKGDSEIHYYDPEKILKTEDKWLKGIGSLEGKTGPLSLEVNEKLFENNIIKQPVKTDTLTNICDKYQITKIDFLKIDTEGHDIKVLESLDLDKVYVKMIKIEHTHVDAQPIIDHLKNNNYIVYLEKRDIYAIK
jgi:FkbM family methyltransferase